MHVDWRNKKCGKKRFLTAELAESVRQGQQIKSRSRGYVGGISARWLKDAFSKNELVRLRAVVEIKNFWNRVDEKLYVLGFTDEQLHKIWEDIEKRIPAVNIRDIDAAQEKLEQVRKFSSAFVRAELQKLKIVSVDQILACGELGNPGFRGDVTKVLAKETQP